MPMAESEEKRDTRIEHRAGLEITVKVRNGKPTTTEIVNRETGEKITKGAYTTLTWKLEQNMNPTLNIFIASPLVSINQPITIMLQPEEESE
jgi:hypothetical protein